MCYLFSSYSILNITSILTSKDSLVKILFFKFAVLEGVGQWREGRGPLEMQNYSCFKSFFITQISILVKML